MQLTEAQIADFKSWLEKCGADLLAPINEGEILRVIIRERTYTVHQRENGHQRWAGVLINLYAEYGRGAYMPRLGCEDPTRPLTGNRLARLLKLAERDGWECWYCGHPLQPADAPNQPLARHPTIEELCPRQIGGPKHIGNQVLSCGDCNAAAGNLAVVEKVTLRERSRGTVGHKDGNSCDQLSAMEEIAVCTRQ